ncbi:uncharacterized protein BXZ73DRAFT_105523 [Epithele typhae]|uniref:uncharacterized protein n=1 Tax=Epithele typhae TaxID=378194 RepID=UPI002008CD82|nr:uncharacterized protein BXZ73DRAFT_105523 [Epithele typhae]KAH9917702.1 hypothetical protein BXZ73DRAFT_105523 [Epithele typhae]
MSLNHDIIHAVCTHLPPSSVVKVAQTSKTMYEVAMRPALATVHLQEWYNKNKTDALAWVQWLVSIHPYLPYPPCHYIKSLITPENPDLIPHSVLQNLFSSSPGLSELVVLNSGENLHIIHISFISKLTTLSLTSATLPSVATLTPLLSELPRLSSLSVSLQDGTIPSDITAEDWGILHSFILSLSKVTQLSSLSLSGYRSEYVQALESELANWMAIETLGVQSPLLDLNHLKSLELCLWQPSLVPPTPSLLHLSVYCDRTFAVLWAHPLPHLRTIDIDFNLDPDFQYVDNDNNRSFSHIDSLRFDETWFIPSTHADYQGGELPFKILNHIKSLASLSFIELWWEDYGDSLTVPCEMLTRAVELNVRSLTIKKFWNHSQCAFDVLLVTLTRRFSPVPLIHLSIGFSLDRLFEGLNMDSGTACKKLAEALAKAIPTLEVLQLQIVDLEEDEEEEEEEEEKVKEQANVWWRIKRQDEVIHLEEIWSDVGEAAVGLIQSKSFRLEDLTDLFGRSGIYYKL